MITIPKKVEYSIELINYLATIKNDWVSLAEVARAVGLPYRFLGQLAGELRSGGVLESHEGKSGGYRLTSGWSEITLYEVLKMLGEDKHMVRCLKEGEVCGRRDGCRMRTIWKKMEAMMIIELKKIKLGEI